MTTNRALAASDAHPATAPAPDTETEVCDCYPGGPVRLPKGHHPEHRDALLIVRDHSDTDQSPIQHAADTMAEVATRHALADIAAERRRQDGRWGELNHDDGTGGEGRAIERGQRIAITDRHIAEGRGSWYDLLTEEVAEAMTETDPDLLRAGLVKVAAVAACWIEAIDRRPL